MYEKFKQYKESTIYSMSNLELLLLLYDEAVKRLKMAQIALEDKKYVPPEQAHIPSAFTFFNVSIFMS